MKQLNGISLEDVKGVYGGPEGDLWELIMGEQIHIGGFASSVALAEKAGIGRGMRGVDLCCCNGAGMRFLVRFRGVASMIGVDATARVLRRGRQRSAKERLATKTKYKLAEVTRTGLPGGRADFVWGEDAWCYVVDKPELIKEAVRLVKKGGQIVFTDWVEGPAGLTEAEAKRFLGFMKFPSVLSISEYADLLQKHGCEVLVSEDTGEFASHMDLYIAMLNKQITYDALRILAFDMKLMQAMGAEMAFMQGLTHSGKIAQGRFVARKI